jgi:hypothetical protein
MAPPLRAGYIIGLRSRDCFSREDALELPFAIPLPGLGERLGIMLALCTVGLVGLPDRSSGRTQ